MSVDTQRLPTLKVGSTGQEVTAAKIGVNHWRIRGGQSSGNTLPVFGVFFRAWVKDFQGHYQIDQTGVIGPRTWNKLLPYLTNNARALLPQTPTLPALGPIWAGGSSVLDHSCTHATDGIPLYPAFDDAFMEGRPVIAPEAITVTRESHSKPGFAFYATGASRLRYWFGHLDRTHAPGTVFNKGQMVGRVGPNHIGGGPHCHLGVNVENLWGIGKELAHHTNYTTGAPTIGAQLRAHQVL